MSRRMARTGRARSDPFSWKVLNVVRRIPPGRVATYGDVARLAGKPRAARAVGNVMKGCGRLDVPCHRVVAAGGRIGGYGGNEVLKRGLLQAEGIVVSGSRIRNFRIVRWSTARLGVGLGTSRPAGRRSWR